MDHDIGRLLDTLDQLNLTDNTLIIYSSDQGIALGSHGLMGKQNLYESTQKVPMLISGPGIPQGRSEAIAYVHDLLPTVAELIGVSKTTAERRLKEARGRDLLHGFQLTQKGERYVGLDA